MIKGESENTLNYEINFKKRIGLLFNSIDKLLKEAKNSMIKIYDDSIHDEKTRVYNYRFFKRMIDIEFEKAKRGKQKLSLMILDVDDFKIINKKYGHIEADVLLIHLAKILNQSVRKSDILARFGGEEFLILLPETHLEKAKKLAVRLRKIVDTDKVLSKKNLKISIGVTEYKKGDSSKRFKKRADKALFIGKKEGKNKCVILA